MEVQGSEIRAPCLIFGEAVWLSGKPLNLRVNKLYGYMIIFGCVTSPWKEMNKTYIRSQNYYRTCIVLGMKWDWCTESSLYSARITVDFQWRNIILCTFSHLAQLPEQFWTVCLWNWQNLLDRRSDTLLLFLLHFCSRLLLPWSLSLDLLASTTSDICFWPNLCQAGLATTNSLNSALLPSGAAWRRR